MQLISLVAVSTLTALLMFCETVEPKPTGPNLTSVVVKPVDQHTVPLLVQSHGSTDENKPTVIGEQAEHFREHQTNALNTSHFVYAHPKNNNGTSVHIKILEDWTSSNATESIQLPTNGSECSGAKEKDFRCSIIKKMNSTWKVGEAPIAHNHSINETNDSDLQSLLRIKSYVDQTVVILIGTIGLIGNFTLVIIFIRHSEMWTLSNICIVTMTIGDFLSIIVNLLAFHYFFLRSSEQWSFGSYSCKFFFFSSDLSVGLSIFGLTALSIQRYCGILVSPFVHINSSHLCFSKSMKVCHILFVWFASFVLALRTFITADAVGGICTSVVDHELSKRIAVINFVIFALFPLLLLSLFHALTAKILFTSAKKIPGADSIKQNALKSAREKSARIILVITVIFFISYVPWFLWQIIYQWGSFERDDKRVLYCFWILYYFFFGSVCFNPIALYCISSSFRRHFQHYLCSCILKNLNALGKTVSRTKESTITESSFTEPEPKIVLIKSNQL